MTNYEKHLKQKLSKDSFRKSFEKESQRVKLAYEISQLRKRKKMSQNVFAQKMGTTQSVVARMESGKQNFSVGTLSKIAEALECEVEISFAK